MQNIIRVPFSFVVPVEHQNFISSEVPTGQYKIALKSGGLTFIYVYYFAY